MGIPVINNERKQLFDILKKSLFLKEAPDEVLNTVTNALEINYYKKGDPVFIEKEVDHRMYFISSGSVEIVSYQQELNKQIRIKVFNEGDHLSEFSLIADTPHSTSCFALENSCLFSLDRDKFYKILNAYPYLVKGLCSSLSIIRHSLVKNYHYINYFCEEDICFSSQMKTIIGLEELQTFKAIPLSVQHGIFHVALVDPFNPTLVNSIKNGTSDVDVKVSMINERDFKRLFKYVRDYYNVGKSQFNHILEQRPQEEEVDLKRSLDSSVYFKNLDENLKKQLISKFQVEEFKTSSIIFKEGQNIGALFVVLKGAINCFKHTQGGYHNYAFSVYQDGEFGDLTLLQKMNSSFLVKVEKGTILAKLTPELFYQLLESPMFSISLSRSYAKKIQQLNRELHLSLYEGKVFNKEVLKESLIPTALIKEYKVIPIEQNDNNLTIGLVNRNDIKAIEKIKRYVKGNDLKFVLIRESDFNNSLSLLEHEIKRSEVDRTGKVLNLERDFSAEQFFEALLEEAYLKNVSDIHLDFLEGELSIRFRLDGRLKEYRQRINNENGLKLISFIKIKANLDISERRMPQDGLLEAKTEAGARELRVSSVPSKLGEKVVMRLARGQDQFLPINMLAPDKEVIRFFKKILRYHQGLFLITGPTGSGKTTTLYSMLSESNSIDTNIITIEDPVEIIYPGITQIEVHDKIGLTYERILRHVLRQDPDTIMVGEVRDKKSAELVFQAALTGHLVFSTLHCNNTLEVIPRLTELGVPSSIIASALVGVMGQRLIPALCSHCKVQKIPNSFHHKFYERLRLQPPRFIYEAGGCEHCDGDGYKGRLPVFEYWANSPDLQSHIIGANDYNSVKKAIRTKTKVESLYIFGMTMVSNGLTTIEMVDKFLYNMDVQED